MRSHLRPTECSRTNSSTTETVRGEALNSKNNVSGLERQEKATKNLHRARSLWNHFHQRFDTTRRHPFPCGPELDSGVFLLAVRLHLRIVTTENMMAIYSVRDRRDLRSGCEATRRKECFNRLTTAIRPGGCSSDRAPFQIGYSCGHRWSSV